MTIYPMNTDSEWRDAHEMLSRFLDDQNGPRWLRYVRQFQRLEARKRDFRLYAQYYRRPHWRQPPAAPPATTAGRGEG